jgi:hypothetical protein
MGPEVVPWRVEPRSPTFQPPLLSSSNPKLQRVFLGGSIVLGPISFLLYSIFDPTMALGRVAIARQQSMCVDRLVRPPGFEPGFPALSDASWEAGVIDQVVRQPSELSADSGPRPLLRSIRATLSKRFLPYPTGLFSQIR